MKNKTFFIIVISIVSFFMFFLGFVISQALLNDDNSTDIPSQCYTNLQPSHFFGPDSALIIENPINGNLILTFKYNQSVRIEHVGVTGSMRPAFSDASFVIVISPKKEDLKIGDIIVFKPDNVVHRIIAIINETYQTKGDNNAIPDPQLVNFEDINSKVIGVLY